MATFSVHMARFKEDLSILARGAAALTRLKPDDAVLIQEVCFHHPQKDDIARVNLLRLLQKLAKGELRISWSAGKEFSKYDRDYKAVLRCGETVFLKICATKCRSLP